MDKRIKMTTAILEAFEDGIYVMNEDLIVEYMNSAMITQFGDGIGKKCHQLLNQTEDKCPWCQSDEVFKGKSIRREIFVPMVDKTYYLIEIPFNNTDGTISKLSIYRDITARKKREEMLRASEEEFKNLFEHVASGVFISSKEGKFLNANHALVDMLGYDNKEDFLSIDLPKDRVDLSKDSWLLQKKLRLDKRLELDPSFLLKQKCVCLCQVAETGPQTTCWEWGGDGGASRVR